MRYLSLFVFFASILCALTLASEQTTTNKESATAPQVVKKEAHVSDSILYNWQNRKRPIPDEYVFQTKYLGGTQIIFNHKKHVHDYKLECIECHHVESCKHCHGKEERTFDVVESKVALHENCFACHKSMSCVDCHKR